MRLLDILRYFGGAPRSMGWGPPVSTDAPPMLEPGPLSIDRQPDLPVAWDTLADHFPVFEDEAKDLDAQAYVKIRRCEPAFGAVHKFGTLLMAYTTQVNGEGARTEQLQEIIDSMTGGLGAVIYALSWARVEGLMFGLMRLDLEASERWMVPAIDVHHSVKAGGTLQWDGSRVVATERRYTTPDPSKYLDAMKPKTFDRRRCIVFRPTALNKVEGDTRLAVILLSIAKEWEQVSESRIKYAARYSLPVDIIKQKLEAMSVQAARTARENAREKMEASRAKGVIGDIDYKMLEPTGTTHQYLSDVTTALESRALKLLLGQSLTTTTGESGPTGSSGVQASEQDKYCNAFAESIAATLTRDLLPWIERANSVHLAPKPPGQKYWIELIPPQPRPRMTPTDVISVHTAGIDQDAEAAFETFGQPKPATIGDILPGKAAPDPFGGMLGGGGGGFGGPPPGGGGSQPVTTPSGVPTVPGGSGAAKVEPSVQLRASVAQRRADEWIEEQVGLHESEVATLLTESIPALMRGEGIGPGLVSSLPYWMARAHMQGASAMRDEMRTVAPDAMQRLESSDDSLVLLRDTPTAVERIARAYAGFGARAKLAADDTMRERVHRKLIEFLESQPTARPDDSAGFVRWMKAEHPQFTDGYSKLVLRNAVSQAYSLGRSEQYDSAARLLDLPWVYLTAGDHAVRLVHARLHGMVFPADARYRVHRPPIDPNCRCAWTVAAPGTPISPGVDSVPVSEFARESQAYFVRLRADDDEFVTLARATADGHWVTLENKTRVKLDNDGNVIAGGPKEWKGKHVTGVGDEPAKKPRAKRNPDRTALNKAIKGMSDEELKAAASKLGIGGEAVKSGGGIRGAVIAALIAGGAGIAVGAFAPAIVEEIKKAFEGGSDDDEASTDGEAAGGGEAIPQAEVPAAPEPASPEPTTPPGAGTADPKPYEPPPQPTGDAAPTPTEAVQQPQTAESAPAPKEPVKRVSQAELEAQNPDKAKAGGATLIGDHLKSLPPDQLRAYVDGEVSDEDMRWIAERLKEVPHFGKDISRWGKWAGKDGKPAHGLKTFDGTKSETQPDGSELLTMQTSVGPLSVRVAPDGGSFSIAKPPALPPRPKLYSDSFSRAIESDGGAGLREFMTPRAWSEIGSNPQYLAVLRSNLQMAELAYGAEKPNRYGTGWEYEYEERGTGRRARAPFQPIKEGFRVGNVEFIREKDGRLLLDLKRGR